MYNLLILLIVFVFGFLLVNKYPFAIFKLVTIVIFTKLIFLLIGIPVTYVNIFIEGILLIQVLHLFLLSTYTGQKFRAPGFWLFILYTVSIAISLKIHDFEGGMKAVSFYRHLLVSYFFFLISYNYPFQEKQIRSFFKLFHFLLVIQIAGAVVKLGTIGLAEKYVGLMEVRAGSLNAIFPLIAISYFAIHHFFYKKVKKFWWIILGFLFVGVVGIKRGFVVFLPVLVVLGLYFYYKYIKRQNFVLLKGFVFSPVIFILLLILVYFAIVFNPLMNKERKIGGSFDLKYAYETSVKHNMGSNTGQFAEGRIASLIEIIGFRFDNLDVEDLFGDGPGMFVNVDNESSGIKDYNVLTFTILSSLCRQLISVGVIGSLSVVLFYTYFLVGIMRKLKTRNDRFGIFICVFVIITGVIFYYDHFVYSPAFFNTHVPNFFFFTLAGLMMNKKISNNYTYQMKKLG